MAVIQIEFIIGVESYVPSAVEWDVTQLET